MKYTIEKDWTTEAGLRAVVVATPMGHRCGYVAVQEGTPLCGLGYDDEKVDGIRVHGGLTYAGGGGKYPVEDGDILWWFGFDCAHYDDAKDGSIMDDSHKAAYEIIKDLNLGGTVKDTAYVVAECEDLARQLKGEQHG